MPRSSPRFFSASKPLLAVLFLSLVACSSGGTQDPGPDEETDGGDQGDGGDKGPPPALTCGDGVLQANEACDDANVRSGDGCAEDCSAIEPNSVCSTAGLPCLPAALCGNGLTEGDEVCDDRNMESGDGCTAHCTVEPGWTCLAAGGSCQAAACGDGIIVDDEECEDDDGATPQSGDGCSDTCRFEPGFKCALGQACVPTVCGDHVTEGTEQCDDGNNDTGDGCSPLCAREPVCSGGTCTAVCGDGLILPGDTTEECDDGNLRNNDGCSALCQLEAGFTCVLTENAPPDSVDIPIVYRDFIGKNDKVSGATGVTPHPDFNDKNGGESGIVGPLYSLMDSKGKPVYAKADGTSSSTSTKANFDYWYNDDTTNASPYNKTVIEKLTLNRQTDGSYVFDTDVFFPLDGKGWVGAGKEKVFTNSGSVVRSDRNFSFTSEARYWFEYKGTEVLSFRGDDDVFVYINRKLALDLGGVHGPQGGTVTLSAQAAQLGLEVGKIYEAAVFQAERHVSGSNYRLTLTNFLTRTTHCQDLCGNGTVNAGEQCDNGTNNGAYGTCNPDCTLPPRCGDSIVQPINGEDCDTGPNGGNGCSKTCKVVFG